MNPACAVEAYRKQTVTGKRPEEDTLDQVDHFETCRRCRNPYPVFENTADPGTCPPCRKRSRARSRGVEPDLSPSDKAYEAVHSLYAKRDSAWRNRLDGIQAEVYRVSHVAGELSDENVDLRHRIAHLKSTVEALRERVEVAEGSAPPNLEAKIRQLKARLATVNRRNDTLRMQLQQAQFQALFRQTAPAPIADLKGALPEGVTVKDLIKLCAPDRHHGGALEEKANEVLKWLITKR